MPMGSSRTQNRTFGRRGKAHLETRQRSAPLRRLSSAEAALSQALFSVPSSALIRISSFGDSDVVMRLRSNSSRRESMAAPPKMETDDADKEGEGATRERSMSAATTDAAAWVLKKDTLLSDEPALLLEQQPLVMQQAQQADEQGTGAAHDDVHVGSEHLAPSPSPQEDTQEGEDRGEEGAVVLQEGDTIDQRRDAEGAGMAGGQHDGLNEGESQEDRRAEEEAEREELPLPGEVGGGGGEVSEEDGERDGAAGEVPPQWQLQIHVGAEVYEEGDVDELFERVSMDVNMQLEPQQQQRLNVRTAEPEEGGGGGGGKRAAVRGVDVLLTPQQLQEDLGAEVAELTEMVEEGGGGGEGEPLVVLETLMPQKPQQQGVEVGAGESVEVKECSGHLVAELGSKGLSSALVVYKSHRRTTPRPTHRAPQHTPIVTLCLRMLRDTTAVVGGPSLRRLMGVGTSAFEPYIRRKPLILASHVSTAIAASPVATTTTTTTNSRTITVIKASSWSPPRSSSAHVRITTFSVLTVIPSTTRARHQRSKTRAAVSAATGAGHLLIDQWRPYVLPDLINPPTTTTPPPHVIDRHVGPCAWMEEDGGQEWGLERLMRERRPGLLHHMRSSLRRVRERVSASKSASSSNARREPVSVTACAVGGGVGGVGEGAEVVAGVSCWSFMRAVRRTNNKPLGVNVR